MYHNNNSDIINNTYNVLNNSEFMEKGLMDNNNNNDLNDNYENDINEKILNEDLIPLNPFNSVFNPLETQDSTVAWLPSLFNLTSTILGAGILALPFAFSRTGYVLGN